MITFMCHWPKFPGLVNRRQLFPQPESSLAHCPPQTVSMLWREEKTEGVRRSATVSMNGVYSPRQLPRSHTGWPEPPSLLHLARCDANLHQQQTFWFPHCWLISPTPCVHHCCQVVIASWGGSSGVGEGQAGSAAVHKNTQPAAPAGIIHGDQLWRWAWIHKHKSSL